MDAPLFLALAALPPSKRRLVLDAGYRSSTKVLAATDEELLRRTGADMSVCRAVREMVQREAENHGGAFPTVLDELTQGPLPQYIVTFSRALDEALGGGVKVGQVTEFAGAPGAGKTQIGMQLAVDVAIPRELGGCEGRAIYIDTEGSVLDSRIREIAGALVKHLCAVAFGRDRAFPPDVLAKVRGLTVEAVLHRIEYHRALDPPHLLGLVRALPTLISESPDVRLVVIDSIAFTLRQQEAAPRRLHFTATLGQLLRETAMRHNVAIVCLNQATTKMTPVGPILQPALGASWGHVSAVRVWLDTHPDGHRTARVEKTGRGEVVRYRVGARGVRDDPQSRGV
eukprot:Sspe_Gene.67306::Locus_39732_Transcript_2_2_Confidence_0.500_Length_1207::g.67306::m.67306/K10870/RAD51L2, RAD51C; RAD51-like protein 2